MYKILYKIRHGLIAMFAIISFSVCCQSCDNDEDNIEDPPVYNLTVEVLSCDGDVSVTRDDGTDKITVGITGGVIKLFFPDCPYNECRYSCIHVHGYRDKIDSCHHVGMNVTSEEYLTNGKSGSLLTLEFMPLDEFEADNDSNNSLGCYFYVDRLTKYAYTCCIVRNQEAGVN